MKRLLLSISYVLLFAGIISAQAPAVNSDQRIPDSLPHHDTLIHKDTLPAKKAVDSVSKRPRKDSAGWFIKPGVDFQSPQFSQAILQSHPYFNFRDRPVNLPGPEIHQALGKEWLFYLLVVLLIIFALIRRTFPRYFGDLFRLFFRTTLKQRQIREQLMQTPLPSLLLNGFFVISGGLYASLLVQHYDVNPVDSFWLLLLYCCLGLAAGYFVKFFGLKFMGWLFNMKEAADAYIFIVFIVNKMIGILLLPFLVVLAFSTGDVYSVALSLSWCLLGGLLLYRIILTFAAVRNQVKVNPFHFFLYLCAFEIAPLLLVYKGLLLFFRITA